MDDCDAADGGRIEGVGPWSCETARSIARVASRLFAERGYDATPVRLIAEESGVTCPTLYYHFGNKEGIAQALLVRPLNGLLAVLRALRDAPLDPVERLTRAASAHFAFSREDPDRTRFLYAVMFGPQSHGLGAEVEPLIRGLHATLAEMAARLSAAGVIPAGREADLVLAFRGQLVIRTMDFLYRGGGLDDGLSRRVVSLVLDGAREPDGGSGVSAGAITGGGGTAPPGGDGATAPPRERGKRGSP